MDVSEPEVQAPSFRRNSVSRLLAQSLGAAFALLTSVILARHLGPSLKGTVSTLGYLVALFSPLAGFGLGEAGITMVGRRRATLQQAVSATIGAMLPAVSGGALLVAAVSVLIVGRERSDLVTPILVTAMTVPLATLVEVLSRLIESRQRVVLTSVARLTSAGMTAVATFVLVDLLQRWTLGAVTAMAVGWAAGLTILAVALRSMGMSLLPRWDPTYLRAALRYGVGVQVSTILVVAFARVDLLLVNGIKGRAAAGLYSISLTLGTLVGYGPGAMMIAAYPRVASLGESEVVPFINRLVRSAFAMAVISVAGLLVIVPLITRPVFGSAFGPSVTASLILVGAGVPWAGQWALSRAWAARGETRLLVGSFAPAFLAMVGLDAVLIPRFGIDGAAAASGVSSVIGFVIAVVGHGRAAGGRLHILQLVPRPQDFVELFRTAREIVVNRPATDPH